MRCEICGKIIWRPWKAVPSGDRNDKRKKHYFCWAKEVAKIETPGVDMMAFTEDFGRVADLFGGNPYMKLKVRCVEHELPQNVLEMCINMGYIEKYGGAAFDVYSLTKKGVDCYYANKRYRKTLKEFLK